MADAQYVDEAYYPWLRVGSQYASFMKAAAGGTDIFIYYQDHFTKLNELHYVAKDHKWSSTPIGTGQSLPMPGTSLAVVNWAEHIRLYYVTTDWHLNEICRDNGGDWYNGGLNAKNITVHPESSVSAVCDNIRIQVFFQDCHLHIHSTINKDGWSDMTDVVTAGADDPKRAMLGSALAFANIGTPSEPRYTGFYQTDSGNIEEVSWSGTSWGQGITSLKLEFDDTDFRTPIATTALHHDGKNTLQLVYAKGGSVYHDTWEEGVGWREQPLLVYPAANVIQRANLTVSSRIFSAGGIKCHLYTSVPPNAVGSIVLQGDEWTANGVIPLFTKHTVKAKAKMPSPPPPPPPEKKTVEAVFYDRMRYGSKFASVIIDDKDPAPRKYCVFYQTVDDAIVMNQYDENTKQWAEMEVVPRGEARAGTPLTAVTFGGYDNVVGIDVFFITPDLTLGRWNTGFYGEGVWKKGYINPNDVLPETDLCVIKDSRYGYTWVYYQAPDAAIREIAEMGDWFDQELRQPALPGTSLAFVDRGAGEPAYAYKKSGIFQAPDGGLVQITKLSEAQYSSHDWEINDAFNVKLPDTSFLTPMSCAVTKDKDGKPTMHLFHVGGDANVKELLHDDENGWRSPPEGQATIVGWKMPPGGSLSAAPHCWYNNDETPARLYVAAPLNAVAEAVGCSDGYAPKDYGVGLVPIGGRTVKVNVSFD